MNQKVGFMLQDDSMKNKRVAPICVLKVIRLKIIDREGIKVRRHTDQNVKMTFICHNVF